MASRRWPLMGAGLIVAALVAAAIYSDSVRGRNVWSMGEISMEQRPWSVAEKDLPAPVQQAIEEFRVKGGRYKFGPNDCSTFVSDFLRASGAKVPERLTTADLADPNRRYLVGLGLARGPRLTGDIFVVRYESGTEEQGHCGILVRTEKGDVYVHNSATMGGVAVQKEEDFAELMRRKGVYLGDLTWLRH